MNPPSISWCRRFSSVSGRSLGCRFSDRRPRLFCARCLLEVPRWLAALLLPEDELVPVEDRHDTILDSRLEARLLRREEGDGAELTALGVCETGLRSPHLDDRLSSVRSEEEEADEESDLWKIRLQRFLNVMTVFVSLVDLLQDW